ncbi:MAG: 50S ribosomal protein L24 [Candidatus Acidiferrales bacterium]
MRQRRAPEKPRPILIRHGDTVKIMAGRDKGKSGRVLSVDPVKRRVTVEHANIIKKHTKPNPSKNIRGGILDKEGPIHVSNVMIVCPNCGKHARIGTALLSDGSKARSCRRCHAAIEG